MKQNLVYLLLLKIHLLKYTGRREAYMSKMDQFIDENIEKFHQFCDEIVVSLFFF